MEIEITKSWTGLSFASQEDAATAGAFMAAVHEGSGASTRAALAGLGGPLADTVRLSGGFRLRSSFHIDPMEQDGNAHLNLAVRFSGLSEADSASAQAQMGALVSAVSDALDALVEDVVGEGYDSTVHVEARNDNL